MPPPKRRTKSGQPVHDGRVTHPQEHPIEPPTGEDMRLFVLDAGPSIDSSFHVVGTIFRRVVQQGVQVELGNEGNWCAHKRSTSRRRKAVIELRTPEEGLYPIVTHALNLPGRGALAVLQAGAGEP